MDVSLTLEMNLYFQTVHTNYVAIKLQ